MDSTGTPPTREELAAELDNAPEYAPDGSGPPAPPDPPEAAPPRSGGRGRGEIFDGSPVTALGVSGDVSFYLDTRGQLRGVDNHAPAKMLHLFGGRIDLLANAFPVFDKDGDRRAGKYDTTRLAASMIAACEEKGVWSPAGRVRGAGFWADQDGQLIVHGGDQVLVNGEWQAPSVYGGYVYTADDPAPRPAPTTGNRVGEAILETLGTWQWRRPDIDPMLLLGGICAQMLGGALDWRPVFWLTGDQATGKSTLQKLLRAVHGGEGGLLQASDATEAGIRSVVGYSSLPVAIDELEPDDDPRQGKAKAIIRLARIAASGDQILRGSSDQKGYQGNAYSSFLFSSILVPPLPPQDRSRLILLDLDPLDQTKTKSPPDWRRLRLLGGHLRRRILDGWDTWHERLTLWQSEFARAGHGGRIGADNYGTVLALADMALNSDLPSTDTIAGWIDKITPYLLSDTDDASDNATEMLTHLMGQQLDVWRRGERFNVATWVRMAAWLPGARESIESANRETANDYLGNYGLRVRGRGEAAELIIANKAINQLRGLFEGTPWADGVWAQAAKRVKGAKPTPSSTRFSGVGSRATIIPLTSIPSLIEVNNDRRRPDASPAPHGGPTDYGEDWA